ncbi:hypothetical protein J1N35_019521 [Gossypium stocksii]|uniref:Uncharacterized protein n=1 Tax=Gossypium stocksii TaxID=47602 RepID=A0A9D3VR31_9ROSI|nr:hypothetical protein J1N35_019521 [Gossypium stocksii]
MQIPTLSQIVGAQHQTALKRGCRSQSLAVTAAPPLDLVASDTRGSPGGERRSRRRRHERGAESVRVTWWAPEGCDTEPIWGLRHRLLGFADRVLVAFGFRPYWVF